jgi:hypothetical protein
MYASDKFLDDCRINKRIDCSSESEINHVFAKFRFPTLNLAYCRRTFLNLSFFEFDISAWSNHSNFPVCVSAWKLCPEWF